MPNIEFDEVCGRCGGTGIYQGRAEDEGAGTVCHVCEGTGCHHFEHEYDEFKERVVRTDIKQVYEHNPGIGIGEGDGYTLEEFGGMPYDEWVKGKPFEIGMEMRKYTCPAWWYQGADYEKKPRWKECILSGGFNACSSFPTKEACWKKWDSAYKK